MARRKNEFMIRFKWQHILPLVLIALTLYVIVPQLDQFKTGLQAAKTADFRLVGVAFVCIAVSVLSASMAYKFLAFTKIPFAHIAIVQYSSMFINRLLPAGLGGISLFVDFFYHHSHKIGRATAVVSVNSLLGLLSHTTLMAFSIIILDMKLPQVSLPTTEIWIIIILVLLAIITVISLTYHFIQNGKIGAAIRDAVSSFTQFKYRPGALLGGYVFGLGNTTCHALAMFFVMHAFGLDPTFAVALLVLTGGVAAATFSPTPGGLLASEAGIAAVLVAYGIDFGPAVAVALTYRLTSYWLPIIPGIIAFIYARKKQLV